MPLTTDNLNERIKSTKRRLRHQIGDYKLLFQQVSEAMKAEIDHIRQLDQTESSAIPEFDYEEIAANGFDEAQIRQIKRAGCVVVHNTLPQDETLRRNDELADYIVRNGYYDPEKMTRPVKDDYFSQLISDKPQIFGIYWSKAQIWARQHPNMATVRRHLNRVWKWRDDETIHFDPDVNLTYADRIRRREPGDASLGLSPHVDSGSIERWIEPNYNEIYRKLFGSDWTEYDAFDGARWPSVEQFRSPAVCSVFRTYQGWVAMTPQGIGDGTLQMVPSSLAVPYMLLRALQDDVPDDDLCGAAVGRALTVSPKWHPMLLDGLVSVPYVEAGDTVWWHPDTVHAVEDVHAGSGYSNVIYVAAVPDCEKNRRFLSPQKEAFLKGRSCPDFVAEDYEVDYHGRAMEQDLTMLGKQQMGFLP